ncbi:MAG: hypothetical protein JWR08_1110 [Enterovirga sp.]|nr:hypothetical protein [Enterovirga sp.]
MLRILLLLATLLQAAAWPAAVSAAPAQTPAEEPVCRKVSHEGAGYVVCTADLRRHEIALFWKGPDGEPYGNFRRLEAAQGGRPLLAATNAGMYDRDLAPVGLYVEDGHELKAANTASGHGNFHLKPNGIFLVEKGRAAVVETGAFLRRRPKPRPDLATQSGPMLVIDGKLHPKISDEGPSRKVRNGVGVRDGGHTVLLAVSEEAVSFGAFARLFRDALGCPDALFLDGSISALYAPALGRSDGLLPLGPMIAIRQRSARAAR